VWNTIARGGEHGISAIAEGSGPGETRVNLRFSNFADDGTPGALFTQGTNVGISWTGDSQAQLPIFAPSCNGDYRQLASSPTVGAGSDDAYLGSSDIEGDPRHTGTIDIGADEFVPPGPSATCPSAAGPGTGPSGAAAGDTSAPVFASASLTNRVFAVDPAGPAEVSAARKARRGTTFRDSLSEPARVVFTIQRKAAGRKRGKRCVNPTRHNRTKRKCTRHVLLGRFAQQAGAGSNSKRWSGKIGRRRARPGRYRATLVATDAAGNRSKPRRLSFRVVRR
jgi:hypothetical protein